MLLGRKREFRLYTNTTQPSFPFSKPKHLVYDANKNVWFAGHGLCRFNTQTQSFDTLMYYFAGANKFEDNILCASPDVYGSIWFHVVENGLVQYDTRQKNTRSFLLPTVFLQEKCYSCRLLLTINYGLECGRR